jgi:hypothetical protein
MNKHQGSEVKNNLWFTIAATAITICVGLLSVDALRGSGDPHYSFWVSPLAFGAYVTIVIGAISLICGLYNIAFPDLSRKRPRGEDDLIRIRDISADSRYTWAQKQPLLEFYLGLRIQISGTIVEVGEWTGYSSRVTVRTSVRNYTVLLDFTDKRTFDQRLRVLAPRTHVTAIGEIMHIEPNGIVLGDCEIVRRASRATPDI